MIQVGVILVLLMGVGGFGGYTYVQKLQADNKVLETNNIVLESSVAEQKEAIEGLQRQAAEISKANDELRATTNRLQGETKNLAKKLGTHELDVLAQNKPELVTRIINRASGAVLRCFEVLIGSPLTEEEKVAKKKSDPGFNRECPSIVNPSAE